MDFFQGGALGDFSGVDALKLAALEEAAALGSRWINRALGTAPRGARLLKEVMPLFALNVESESDELLRLVGGLQADVVKKDAVAAQAAGVAKPGRGIGVHGVRTGR
jgi:hypothetical protein